MTGPEGSDWRGGARRAWTSSRDFVLRLQRRFVEAHVPMLAAALAYFAAFSLGPLLILLAGWLGSTLRNQPELAERYRNVVARAIEPALPAEMDSMQLVERSLDIALTELGQGTLLRGALSLIVLLWASSGFFAVLQQALETIFEVPRTRGFVRRRVVAFLLVGAVALVVVVELIGVALGARLLELIQVLQLQLASAGVPLPELPNIPVPGEPLRVLVGVAALTLCYRYLPRQMSRWRGALAGAFVSVAGLQGMRVLLPVVLDAEQFSLVYGVVTSLMLLLLWLFLSLLLFLVGAVVAAEVSSGGRDRALA